MKILLLSHKKMLQFFFPNIFLNGSRSEISELATILNNGQEDGR